MIICSVYDNKAKFFMTPFFGTTRGEVIRQFIHACNDVDHQFYQYAEDYTLLEIGTWEPSTGHMEFHPEPEALGRARELKGIYGKPAADELVRAANSETEKLQ